VVPLLFPFNNGGGIDQGMEIAFDYSALGISTGQCMEAFTMIVSTTAFFSDVTVPGNLTGGINPGFEPELFPDYRRPVLFHSICAQLLPY
jgi:hypothetical protein